MKKILFLFCLTLIMCDRTYAQVTPGVTPERFTPTYISSLGDKFTSGSLNSSVWSDGADWVGRVCEWNSDPNFETYFTPGTTNMTFTGADYCNLQARKPTGGYTATENNPPSTFSPGNFPRTGKILTSKNFYYYGYFEFMAKVPTQANGHFSTGQQIWLYHAYSQVSSSPLYNHPDASWIKKGYSEIDVFEINNHTTNDYSKVPIATHYWPNGALFTTTNGGGAWSNSYQSGLNYAEIRCLVKDVSDTYAGTDGGIYKHNGTSWSAMSPQVPNPSGGISPVKAIAISGTTIFAGTDAEGVYKYSGGTWTQSNTGLSNTKVRSLLIVGSLIFAGTENGIFYSSTSSVNWTQVSGSSTHMGNALVQNGSNIYAGTASNGVYKLNSTGTTYTLCSGTGSSHVLSLFPLGSDVFAGTESGLYQFNTTTSARNLLNFGGQNVTALTGFSSPTPTVYTAVNGSGICYATSTNWTSWTNVGNYSSGMEGLPVSALLLPYGSSNPSHIWAGSTTAAYYYNNPSEGSIPSGETSYTPPTALDNWHKYGVNWQRDYVDFYMDDKLYSHVTVLGHLDNDVVPVSRLQPMAVVLSTIFTFPGMGGATEPALDRNQEFTLDYFRYYKMTPEITNLTYNSGTIAVQASEGIDDEDYSWSVTSGAAAISAISSPAPTSSTASVTVNSGVSEIQVTSTTGSGKDNEPMASGGVINPSTSASTKIKISNANCWNMCQSDIATSVSNFWARCINAPGSPCTTFNVPDTGNQHGIKLMAQTGIQLNAGFNVANGYSFEAVCH